MRGWGGGAGGWKRTWRWRKREIVYLSLHCHHQNDSCIKMGSDESHFNVSLTVRDKVTRQCPQTTTFPKRRERESRSRGIEPIARSAHQPNVLPPGQTVPHNANGRGSIYSYTGRDRGHIIRAKHKSSNRYLNYLQGEVVPLYTLYQHLSTWTGALCPQRTLSSNIWLQESC